MISILGKEVIGKCLSCGKLLTETNTYYNIGDIILCKECYESGEKHEWRTREKN